MENRVHDRKRKRAYKRSQLPTIDADVLWYCRYCGEENSVWIDLTVPGKQDFIEDCQVCCRPNRLIVTLDDQQEIFLETRLTTE